MKRYLLLVVLAALAGAGVLSALAVAKDPPPGDVPCSHGASGKPCRPDPSTNGKDCDAHGKGGINEDHCLATTTVSTTESTETTTTGRTTTSQTTTTSRTTTSTPTSGTTVSAPGSTSASPAAPPSSTAGGTQTAPTTTAPTTTTSSAPSSSPPATGSSVAQTPQSKPTRPGKAPPTARTSTELPYTGFPAWLVALLGVGLVVGGAWIVRRA